MTYLYINKIYNFFKDDFVTTFKKILKTSIQIVSATNETFCLATYINRNKYSCLKLCLNEAYCNMVIVRNRQCLLFQNFFGSLNSSFQNDLLDQSTLFFEKF